MSIEKLKTNKKILILLAFLVVASTIFFAFGDEVQDWRKLLDINNKDQSKSQMKVEIIRDGVVLDPSLSSTLTNELDLSDIVSVPPTINAQVGDKIRITDISSGSPNSRAWDFQTFKNGSPTFSQQYFWGNQENPFPYELELDEEAEHTFYLNVYNGSSKTWSSYGDYRTMGVYKDDVTGVETPMWWYFTTLRVVVGEEEVVVPPDEPEIKISGNISDRTIPYLDYVEDDIVDIPINFTANGYDDTGFNWEVNINSQKFNFTNESKNLNKTLKVNKENINLLSENSYSVKASKDELSDSKNGNFNVSLENEPPEEFFQWFTMIGGERVPYLYVGLQSVFTTHREGMSIDPEDDIFTEYYKLSTPSGHIALEFKKNYLTGDIELDYMDLLINSVNLVERENSTDLLIDFKIDGDYYTYLELEDMKTTGDLSAVVIENTRNKVWWSFPVQVTPEPTPPVADFDMPRYSIPNHNVPVVDKSTDINNDIKTRNWTHTGTSSGTLNGMGGNIQYPNVGTYQVSLNVTDYTNLSNSITKTIDIVTIKAILDIDTHYEVEGEQKGKVNRLVVLNSSESIAIPENPIQNNLNEWKIVPLDGQSASSIKIDTDTSTNIKKNVLFKEIGKYEVLLTVKNASESSTDTQIIDVVEDTPPVINFAITTPEPNFKDNPTSVDVSLKDFSFSDDKDILNLFDYTLESVDKDGSGIPFFTSSKSSTTPPQFNFNVPFREGSSARFKANIKIKEKFGQPTIEKFVTASDRLETIEEREFLINWIPFIEYKGLPDKFYSDEEQNLTTILKDEKLDTCNVEWTLKMADQLDFSLFPADIDTLLTKKPTKNGGALKFNEGVSGYFELTATITDEHGATSFFSKKFRVYPLPTANLEDNPEYRYKEYYDLEYGEAWKVKQNRKMGINGMSSFHTDYYTPDQPFHNINHGYDYWEIVPLDGQSVGSIMIKQNKTQSDDSATKLNPSTYNMDKFIAKNVPLDIELLFKEHGRYQINYQVTTLNNKKSIMASKIITVIEDTEPRIDFYTPDIVYRNEDGETATISISAVNFYSLDGDFTPKENMRLRYKFDSNNDGIFDEDFLPSEENNWVSVPFNESGKRFDITVNHVGKYQIELLGKETYREPTIGSFISNEIGNSDRKEKTYYTNVEVDNLAPLATLSVNDKTVKEIDIMVSSFNLGNEKNEFFDKVGALKTRLWNEKQVKANIIPYRDTQVNDSNPNDIKVDYSLLDDMLTMDYNDNQKFVVSKGKDYSYPPYGNDRHTVFLLQSDHESVSNTFVDSSWVNKKKPRVALAKTGNPIHTPEEAKIGKSSIYFDGSSSIYLDYSPFNRLGISGYVPPDQYAGVRSSGYSIDMWVYPESEGSLLKFNTRRTTYPVGVFSVTLGSDGTIGFQTSGLSFYSDKKVEFNKWSHVVVQCDNVSFYSTIRVAVNGVFGGVPSSSGGDMPLNGQEYNVTIGGGFKGYLDEVRFTKAYKRYEGNFTPETKHYRSVPDPFWEEEAWTSTGNYWYADDFYKILNDGSFLNMRNGRIHNPKTGVTIQSEFRPPKPEDINPAFKDNPTWANATSWFFQPWNNHLQTVVTPENTIMHLVYYSSGSTSYYSFLEYSFVTNKWKNIGIHPYGSTFWGGYLTTFNNKTYIIGGKYNSSRTTYEIAYYWNGSSWISDPEVAKVAKGNLHYQANWYNIEMASFASTPTDMYVMGDHAHLAFSHVKVVNGSPVYERLPNTPQYNVRGRFEALKDNRYMAFGVESGNYSIYDATMGFWYNIPRPNVRSINSSRWLPSFYNNNNEFVFPVDNPSTKERTFLTFKEADIDIPEPYKSVTELYSPTKRVQIMGEQLSNNTDILFINNTSNQAIINNTLALSGNKGAFIPESNINTEVEAIYQYISSKLEEEEENLTYFTFDPKNDINDVDVTLGVDTEDPENDPEFPESRRIKFNHNNSTLKAPDGTLYPLEPTPKYSLHDNWVSLDNNPENEYDFNINRSGTYTINYETKDNPLKNLKLFDPFNEYRKTSIGGEATIIVHRKPVPEVTVQARESGGMLQLYITDVSYDPDHKTTLANKGIASRSWKRINSDTNTWINNVPLDQWFSFGTKDCAGIIELTVTDVLGAESTLTLGIPELKALFDISHDTLRLKNDGTLVENQNVTDRSYSTSTKPIVRWEWNIGKTSGTGQGYNTKNYDSFVNHSDLNNWTNAFIRDRGKGDYYLSLVVKDSEGNTSKRPYKRSFSVLPRVPKINFDPEHPVYIEKDPFNWNFNVSNPDNTTLQYSWSLKNYMVSNTSQINGSTPYNLIELTKNDSSPPFTGSFKNNNLKYGVYDITVQLLEKLTNGFGETIRTTKRIYIVPEINLKGSFYTEGEVIVGENITLLASTSKETERVFVDLIAPDGITIIESGIELTSSLLPSGKLHWEKVYTIPDSVSESGEYSLRFTAQSIYGGEYYPPTGVSREETDLVKIDITALKLMDFRITNIVNHPEGEFEIEYPLQKDTGELPFDKYKTGYYVTFRINSIGQPLEVKATAKVDGIVDSEKGNVEFTKVDDEGIEQVWEGKYYSSANLDSGEITLENIIARKGMAVYNYNLKDSWNGHILTVKGTAYQDGRVNRTE